MSLRQEQRADAAGRDSDARRTPARGAPRAPRTSAREAPSAMRIPISRRRRLTRYASTPATPTAASESASAAKIDSSDPVSRGVAIEASTTAVIGRTFATGRFGSSRRTSARIGPGERQRVAVGAHDERHAARGVAAPSTGELRVRNVELLLDRGRHAVVAHVPDDADDRHPRPVRAPIPCECGLPIGSCPGK